jgi:DNA-binding ferritin-like protein (Dps family)
MDPITIAVGVVGALTPYLAKGAEEFAKAFGKDLYEQTKRLKQWLWNKVKEKDSNDKSLTKTLELYEGNPNRFEQPLKDALADFLKANPDLAKELAQMLPEKDQSRAGRNVVIHGGTVTGIQMGDNSSQEINAFDPDQKKKPM